MPDRPSNQRRFNLKFVPGAASEERLRELAQMPGVAKVEPLFPGESQPDLASLMVVDVDEDKLDQALPDLRARPDVEYIEEPAPRKLIRPVVGKRRTAKRSSPEP
jgi:hypothetical protein